MSFYNQTTGAAHRVHDTLSHPFTVTQYEWDDSAGANDYADGDWTKVQRRCGLTLEFPEEAETVDGPEGGDIVLDAIIYVQPNEIDVTIGTADESRATEFTDEQTGNRYRAVNTRNEQSLLAVDCERI